MAAVQSGPNLYTASSWIRRVLGINLLVGVGIIVLMVTFWRHHSSPTEIETSLGGTGWMRYVTQPGDAGLKQSRQVVLYRPSLGATDGRLEFAWAVAPAGVAWVFRAADLGNYYAMRLKVLAPGPSPTVSLEHFTVQHSIEGPHFEKVLVLSRNDPAIRVRTDVFGPAFTVYLQGNASDYWTDGRLTSGAFGFLEDWYQGADIRSVRMSLAQRTRIQPELSLPDLQQFFAMNGLPSLPGTRPATGGV